MPGFFDQSTVNQVQQANDIADVISEHVSLVKKGREMVGLCPFHEDHRPSLYVNVVKQIFKCFACGAGGDVFKFVQMRENLTFPQAIERLAERAGIKLKRVKTENTKPKTVDADPNELARVNEWAAGYFRNNLVNKQEGKSVLDYIAQRKITTESANKWQLGLAVSGNDLIKAAKAKGISMKLLEQAGLIVPQMGNNSFADKFVNRLMFPIADVTGRIVGFGGRTLDENGAKYINSPTTALFDKSNSLYGLQQGRHNIVSTQQAVVVEGYTDCIMAHQFGCGNVVATLGTSFTTGHGRLLRRYAKKAVLVFDSDVAGVEAANRAIEICLSQRIDIKLASVPGAKDPCEFLLSAGKEQFEQLVNGAVDVFRFKWDRLVASFGSDDTLTGKKVAVEEFLQTVATAVWAGHLPAIDKGLIVNRLSKIIGADAGDINAELSKKLRTAERTANYNAQDRKLGSIDLGRGYFAIAQREILEVLLNAPELFGLVKQKITVEVFDVPILKQIAEILFETLNAEDRPSLAEILAKAESPELGSCIVQLAQAGEEKGNFKSCLTGALDALRRYQGQKGKVQIDAVQDQKEFLRNYLERSEKQNPRSVGMT